MAVPTQLVSEPKRTGDGTSMTNFRMLQTKNLDLDLGWDWYTNMGVGVVRTKPYVYGLCSSSNRCLVLVERITLDVHASWLLRFLVAFESWYRSSCIVSCIRALWFSNFS